MSMYSQEPWRDRDDRRTDRHGPPNSRKRPADTQERAWIADEDRFVLQQAKKKAQLRVKESRARPSDWLAVTLRFIDPHNNPIDEYIRDTDLDVVDPAAVFEGLDNDKMDELEKDIDMYLSLETTRSNRDFWDTMYTICKDGRAKDGARHGRGLESVSADVDRLFKSKTLDELEALETQIKAKLRSNEPIDTDYWESLLRSLASWKARAKLRRLSQTIIDSRMSALREQEATAAEDVRKKLTPSLAPPATTSQAQASTSLDLEPFLKIREGDKQLEVVDEHTFLKSIAQDRQRILKMGYVPAGALGGSDKPQPKAVTATKQSEVFPQKRSIEYEREVARGMGEDEEVFAGEEEVATPGKHKWDARCRPRKPRHFNRVQMGYEWNKYNQTHYDHENPPPRVVQGYRFNIFYPELIDKTKAPTYKMEREHGRKRGERSAPAGEEETCLIRFVAGAPYEDIAFRIVDKEWDYSAKRERGFKSSFDKGVLQLHFQFKKIFYRK